MLFLMRIRIDSTLCLVQNSQYFSSLSFSCIHVYWSLHCSLQSFLESRIVIIVIKEKERALRHLYQTRAKARIISEIEEVQKQMNADMEATKEQMTTMMEAKMSIRKMMEEREEEAKLIYFSQIKE